MIVRRAPHDVARALCRGRASLLLVSFVVLACIPNCRGTSRNVPRGAVSAASKSAQRSTAVAVDVCVGEKRSCALASDGRVACWGDNRGQWLAETSAPQLGAPVELADLAPAASLQCPNNGVCVRSRAGVVSCRAENARSAFRPPLPAPALDFVALKRDGCAILENKTVACFDLAPPFRNLASNAPPIVEGAFGATAIFASGSASRVCVRREADQSVCFELSHPGVPTVRVGEKLPPPVWLAIEHLQAPPVSARSQSH